MNLTKNLLFFFCFLFTATVVNGGNQSVSSISSVHIIQSASDRSQDELQLTKDDFAVCFRLIENRAPFFKKSEPGHPLFDVFYPKQLLFSKQSYSSYKVNLLNQLGNTLLYIYHRQFRI